MNKAFSPGKPKFFNLKDIIVNALDSNKVVEGFTTVFTDTQIALLEWLHSFLAR